ncbi:MAG: hypothetical protein NT018_06265 [Armatimonadetes bacterium]|nr:hypothetical protein [Armatimonadota bacterium]
MKLNNRGNWSLIGLLVTAAIIGVVMFFMLGKNGFGPSSVRSDSKLVDQSSKKHTIYGKAMDTAKGADCQERLRQIKLGIASYKASSTDESFPATLKDVGLSVGADYFNCPVSNQPYTYDRTTGAVNCPYPGHSNF